MPPPNPEARSSLVSDPDLGAVASLMNRSWKRPCWHYSPALLREYLVRPGRAAPIAVGIERNHELIGFFAGLPMQVSCRGQNLSALFTSFLTVAPEARDPSISLRMFAAVVAGARARGITHAFTVSERDPEANRLVRLSFQVASAPMYDLQEFAFLTRPAGIGAGQTKLPDPRVLVYEPRWRAAVQAELGRLVAATEVAQVIAPAELDAVLASPTTVTQLFVTEGRVRGILVGRRREYLAATPRRQVHLDLVSIAQLTPDEQAAFLAAGLPGLGDAATDAYVAAASGAFDDAALRRCGFLRLSAKATLAVAQLQPDAAVIGRVEKSWFEVF